VDAFAVLKRHVKRCDAKQAAAGVVARALAHLERVVTLRQPAADAGEAQHAGRVVR
jgi:hypothetical protein